MMKKYLPLIILVTLSILFYGISARSYALQSSHLENMELFRLFRGISNIIVLFVPLMMFVFYMLTSSLMFTLLDEKFHAQKMAQVISLSFLPVILNCLIYLIVLFSITNSGSLQKMLNQTSRIGLSIADMEEVSYLFWFGFYLFFALLIKHEFRVSIGRAVAVAFIPTLMVMTVRFVINFF